MLLLLDFEVVMTGKRREWESFSRLGTCFLPVAVYDEIELLMRDASESTQELVASDFLRFWPRSGWQLTNATGSHSSLQPATGVAGNRQARLMVAVAQCTYGLSQQQPKQLVVFVSTSLSLIKRLQSLGVTNLCAIPSVALLQWAKSGVEPQVVSDQLRILQQSLSEKSPFLQPGMSGFSSETQNSNFSGFTTGKPKSSASHLPTSGKPKSSASHLPTSGKPKSSASQSKNSKFTTKAQRRQEEVPEIYREPYKDISEQAYVQTLPRFVPMRAKGPNFFASLISSLIALGALIIAVGFGWRIIQPSSFDVFWRQQVMPVWQQKIVPSLPQPLKQFIGK
ncbi:MAG TPA: PIN domain-containing protein [Halomicronema sp.]